MSISHLLTRAENRLPYRIRKKPFSQTAFGECYSQTTSRMALIYSQHHSSTVEHRTLPVNLLQVAYSISRLFRPQCCLNEHGFPSIASSTRLSAHPCTAMPTHKHHAASKQMAVAGQCLSCLLVYCEIRRPRLFGHGPHTAQRRRHITPRRRVPRWPPNRLCQPPIFLLPAIMKLGYAVIHAVIEPA